VKNNTKEWMFVGKTKGVEVVETTSAMGLAEYNDKRGMAK